MYCILSITGRPVDRHLADCVGNCQCLYSRQFSLGGGEWIILDLQRTREVMSSQQLERDDFVNK